MKGFQMSSIKKRSNIFLAGTIALILILSLSIFLVLASGCKKSDIRDSSSSPSVSNKEYSPKGNMVANPPAIDLDARQKELNVITTLNTALKSCVQGEGMACRAILSGDSSICKNDNNPTICYQDYMTQRYIAGKDFDCKNVGSDFINICNAMMGGSLNIQYCESLPEDAKEICTVIAGGELSTCNKIIDTETKGACEAMYWEKKALKEGDAAICEKIWYAPSRRQCAAFVEHDLLKCKQSIFDSCVASTSVKGIKKDDCKLLQHDELREACLSQNK
jgi:hypothetical protein